MEIRECGESDFEQVLALLRQLWPDMVIDAGRMRAVFESCLEAHAHVQLCVLEGGEVIGFLAMTVKHSLWRQGKSAYVDVLVVSGPHRGRGAGKALLEAAAEVAASRGCDVVELDSFFHREEAHRFYEKQGYAREGYIFSRTTGASG